MTRRSDGAGDAENVAAVSFIRRKQRNAGYQGDFHWGLWRRARSRAGTKDIGLIPSQKDGLAERGHWLAEIVDEVAPPLHDGAERELARMVCALLRAQGAFGCRHVDEGGHGGGDRRRIQRVDSQHARAADLLENAAA